MFNIKNKSTLLKINEQEVKMVYLILNFLIFLLVSNFFYPILSDALSYTQYSHVGNNSVVPGIILGLMSALPNILVIILSHRYRKKDFKSYLEWGVTFAVLHTGIFIALYSDAIFLTIFILIFLVYFVHRLMRKYSEKIMNKVFLSYLLVFLLYLLFNLLLHTVFRMLIIGVFIGAGMATANGYSEGDGIFFRMFIGGIVALPTLLIMLVGILIAHITKKSIKPFLYIGLMFATAIFIGYTFEFSIIYGLLEADWSLIGETEEERWERQK
jgi:hypothetical protein